MSLTCARWTAVVMISSVVAVTISAGAHAARNDRQSQGTSRSITPMMTIELGRARSELPIPGNPNSDRSPVGGYTRLTLRFVPPTETYAPEYVRDYNRQKRSALSRYFAGKSIARVFSIKASLARPRVSTAAMMTSLGYESNKQVGETWTSELNSQRVLTPYFRIDADSAVNIEALLTATSAYDVTAATDLLDIVKRAATLVAPAATLVTSLNKERFQDASQFVDQSIAGLLKESIVERASNDFAVGDWAGGRLATVRLWLPTGKELTPSAKSRIEQQAIEIGAWEIYSTPAILSVFSDTRLDLGLPGGGTGEQSAIVKGGGAVRPKKKPGTSDAKDAGKSEIPCEKPSVEMYAACVAYSSIDQQTIMNFPVDSGISIGQALAGDSAIGAARERLIQAGGPPGNADGLNENARALCTLLAAKVQLLGFNRFDVAAILWAYASQSFVTSKAGSSLGEPGNCAPLKLAYAAGLPKGSYAAADDKRAVLPPAATPAIDVPRPPLPPPAAIPAVGTDVIAPPAG